MRIPLQPTERYELNDMTTDEIEVKSTSSVTAETSPVVLKQTNSLRLRFVPTLVENKKDPQKSVSGKLVYERKSKKEQSFPTDDTVSRRSIRNGEFMELQLDTTETYKLYCGLKQRYELYEDMDKFHYGTATYAKVDRTFKQFLSMIKDNPSAARMITNEENLVRRLLGLITQTESLDTLKKSLNLLQDENLQHLATSLNIAKLQRVAKLMKDNLDNNCEEFWQKDVFKENQWVLAQIFACPCTVYQDKAYVGGKLIDNSRGNICDFMCKNRLSQNVALIEIKTPCTKIIGKSYRNTYSFSQELSGAVNQVLNYKDGLTKDYYSVSHNYSSKFKVLSPKCIVIIGKLAEMTSEQIDAFENFRNSLNNVIILTFDEIYQRIVDLINIFSKDPSEQNCI